MLKAQYTSLIVLLILSFLNCGDIYGSLPLSIDYSSDSISKKEPENKKRTKWLKRMILIRQSKNKYENRKYDKAIKKAMKAFEIDTTFFKTNYLIGFTYYESPYEKTKAIPYLERSLKYTKKDTLGEIFYYQGEIYLLNGQPDESINAYNYYLKMLERFGATYLYKQEQNELKKEIAHHMEMCKNAKDLMSKPLDKFEFKGTSTKLKIALVDENINSSFNDYSNILSPDDSILFFTSRRKGLSGKKLDFWDDKYFEDIYFSELSGNGWRSARAMDRTINTKDHDASNSLSNDGRVLYLYRGPDKGSFYKSEFFDSKWNKPIKLSRNSDTTINSKSWETSMNLNSTGDTIYVASDRDDGFGDRDLYWTTQDKDGAYGRLHNLGDSINTIFDEDAPFLTADGKTLYFSSRGHNSMGGFDIFKSERTATGWSKPVNIGYPINSTCDDIYFTITHKGNLAYFSSSRVVKGRNDFNIYSVQPAYDTIHNAVINGYVRSNNVLKNARIVAIDARTKQQAGTYPVESNEKYSLNLLPGNSYLLSFEAENFTTVTQKVEVPFQYQPYDLFQKIDIELIPDTLTSVTYQHTTFKNAFFNTGLELPKVSDHANQSLFLDSYLATIDKKNTRNYSEISLIDTIKKVVPKTVENIVVAQEPTKKTEAPKIIAETKAPEKDTTETGIVLPKEPVKKQEPAKVKINKEVIEAKADTTGPIPIPENILFDFNASIIKEEYLTRLDELVNYMNANKKTRLEIKGHTDTKGSPAYNLNLSKKRALAVLNYLKTHGINQKYLSVIGSGENEPVHPETNSDGSDNPDGRRMNRRVELKLVPLKTK